MISIFPKTQAQFAVNRFQCFKCKIPTICPYFCSLIYELPCMEMETVATSTYLGQLVLWHKFITLRLLIKLYSSTVHLPNLGLMGLNVL